MLKAFIASILMLSAPLAANPDLDGHLTLKGGMQVFQAAQKGNGLGNKLEYTKYAAQVFGFELVAPLTEYLSVAASLDSAGESDDYKYTADAGAGTLIQHNSVSFQTPQLGVTLYPAHWIHGLFVPGVGNPDGPLYTPILSTSYIQMQGTHITGIEQATGVYAGYGSGTYSSRHQGFGLGFDLPIFRSGTVYHRYQRFTWSQTFTDNWSLSEANTGEQLLFGARIYSSLNAPLPLDPAEYLPLQGRPGSLRVDLGVGWINVLNNSSDGLHFWWAEVRHALDSRLALSLRFERKSLDRGPFDRFAGFKVGEQNLNSDRVTMGAFFNFGSPRWRGKARETAVDAKPVGIPKELPEPEAKPEEAAPEPKP